MATSATSPHQLLLGVIADPSKPWRERVRFFYGSQLETFQTPLGFERGGRQMHMEHMVAALDRGEGPAVAFLLCTRDFLRLQVDGCTNQVRLDVWNAIEGIDELLLALESEHRMAWGQS